MRIRCDGGDGGYRTRVRTSVQNSSCTSLVHSRGSAARQEVDELAWPTPSSRRPAQKANAGSRSVSDSSSIPRIKEWRTGSSVRLREGRSKGRSSERRSDRAANLRNDVGSCRSAGQDLRADSTRSACEVVKRPSSMLIHPLIRRIDEWSAQCPAF